MTEIRTFLAARYAEDRQIASDAGATRNGTIATWHVDCDHPDICPDDCRARRIEGDDADDFTIYDEGGHDEHQARHIARHDPRRVLAEVEAKQRRLRRHQAETTKFYDRHGDLATFTACEICGNGGTTDDAWPCDELRDDAAPYADHVEYQGRWRP